MKSGVQNEQCSIGDICAIFLTLSETSKQFDYHIENGVMLIISTSLHNGYSGSVWHFSWSNDWSAYLSYVKLSLNQSWQSTKI